MKRKSEEDARRPEAPNIYIYIYFGLPIFLSCGGCKHVMLHQLTGGEGGGVDAAAKLVLLNAQVTSPSPIFSSFSRLQL
jgi:hypothetical protein